jgi:hypothetical protein
MANVPAPPTRAARLLAEFDTLFRGADLAPTYARALSGKLKLSCARSLCWRLFLGALPEDRAGWRAAVAESRSVIFLCPVFSKASGFDPGSSSSSSSSSQ